MQRLSGVLQLLTTRPGTVESWWVRGTAVTVAAEHATPGTLLLIVLARRKYKLKYAKPQDNGIPQTKYFLRVIIRPQTSTGETLIYATSMNHTI
jgi:hypothetical protein